MTWWDSVRTMLGSPPRPATRASTRPASLPIRRIREYEYLGEELDIGGAEVGPLGGWLHGPSVIEDEGRERHLGLLNSPLTASHATVSGTWTECTAAVGSGAL